MYTFYISSFLGFKYFCRICVQKYLIFKLIGRLILYLRVHFEFWVFDCLRKIKLGSTTAVPYAVFGCTFWTRHMFFFFIYNFLDLIKESRRKDPSLLLWLLFAEEVHPEMTKSGSFVIALAPLIFMWYLHIFFFTDTNSLNSLTSQCFLRFKSVLERKENKPHLYIELSAVYDP